METNPKRAFVFPGQGCQAVGMGHDLYNKYEIVRRTFEEASDVLGKDIMSLCFEGSKDELSQTENVQPAIFVVSMAALRVLEKMDIYPDQVAGHSLGEYSALVAAKVLSFTQALELVQDRGEYMQEAGLQNPGKMAVVLKLPVEVVRGICDKSGAEMANINSQRQIVISGKKEDVENASGLVKVNGGRVVGLNVSVAGHSFLMEPAAKKLKDRLKKVDIGDPQLCFVANATGDYVSSGLEVGFYLVEQMTKTVFWLKSIETMIRSGVEEFVDVGPGKVQVGIIKKINPEVTVKSFDSLRESD